MADHALQDRPERSGDTTGAQPILHASKLCRRYRSGTANIDVLHELDLEVRAGEFISIEGRSGSGKSTLLHILGALDTAQSGTIEYQGQDIVSLSSRARSRLRNIEFGFVFQFYHLLPELNVLENTLVGPMIEQSWLGYWKNRAELRQRAIQLLHELGMGERLKHRPSQLSGGERQRVAIARALMNRPKVLFADEPTGNLDVQTGQQIMAVLERLHQEQQQTIVMVTHDRTLAQRADRALRLENGHLMQVA